MGSGASTGVNWPPHFEAALLVCAVLFLKTKLGLPRVAVGSFFSGGTAMRVGTAGLVAAAGLGVLAAFGPHIAAQAPARAAGGQITFTRDVAPILQRSCQACHRPNSMAPMSFLTYQDVRPWARAIKTKVTAREMPPWYIDRTVGISKFKDD